MLEALAKAAHSFPAIDNHAHNILTVEKSAAFPLAGLAGEAAGEAAEDTKYTLALMRASKQLATLFECNSNWETIEATRNSIPYEELCRKCFEPTGIQCLLLDDLMIGIENNCQSTASHGQFTKEAPKRIIRLETVAEELISALDFKQATNSPLSRKVFKAFMNDFRTRIQSYCEDPEVVGFKSVACYRTGLDISPSASSDDIYNDFIRFMGAQKLSQSKKVRLASKLLNDGLVCATLKLAGHAEKPVQFHTGLGDNDIELAKANPALMQSVIKAFPNTTFVILHSSYPFTQEAGYLTSVYKNVYLDFGEIFPFVSADGQRQVIRQVLELCPTNKILWSTDGHYWPETFYLGSIQARLALFEVLSDTVNREDLSEDEAVEIVQRALFYNANKLYNLGLQPDLSNNEVIPRWFTKGCFHTRKL